MMIPLGIAGIFHENVTLVVVGFDLKFLGASSGPV